MRIVKIFYTEVFYDMIVMIFATILTYFFAITKKSINRGEGAVLFVIYIAYLVYIIMRYIKLLGGNCLKSFFI